MTTTKVLFNVSLIVTFLAFNAAEAASSQDSLDQVSIKEKTLDSSLPMRVQRFSTDGAYLGKAKHSDTARIVQDSVGGMLLVDLIEELREGGFADVAEYDPAEVIEGPYYRLSGDFTELNPGSQSARVIWGLGAGKSKVCVKGEIHHLPDRLAGTFASCDKSLGWGNSEDQLESEAYRLGLEIGAFLVDWSKR